MTARVPLMVTAFLFVLVLVASSGCSTPDDSVDPTPGDSEGDPAFPVLKGDYLGQAPPGLVPEVFAPGIVSTTENDLNAVFSSDGQEFYFSVRSPTGRYAIKVMRQENGQWTRPETASFSGLYSDVDPALASAGDRLFFISNRPLEGGGPPYHIWMTVRTAAGLWGEPEDLGPPVNSVANDIYPSVSEDGTLYFASDREGGNGGRDIYVSRLEDGRYSEVQNVGGPINTEFDEVDVFIAPDESYMIFLSFGRPHGYGDGDLYIGFREEGSTWSEARNMGDEINSAGLDYCPSVSPNGRFFFFTRVEMENGDVFWVDAAIIDQFRRQ